MLNILLKEAINELKNVKCGTIFVVKDLFRGYQWNEIDKKIRLDLGRTFLNEIKAGNIKEIEILEKNSANQQKYKKL